MAGVSKNSPGCNCCIGLPPDPPPPPPADCCPVCVKAVGMMLSYIDESSAYHPLTGIYDDDVDDWDDAVVEFGGPEYTQVVEVWEYGATSAPTLATSNIKPGARNLPTDWTYDTLVRGPTEAECIAVYDSAKGGAGVDHPDGTVLLFVDNSGSMDLSTLGAGYTAFKEYLTDEGVKWKQILYGTERWVKAAAGANNWLFDGEFDATITGFTDSTECLQCDFINGTFTLSCLGGNGLCSDVPLYDTPANLDPDRDICYWGVSFDDYIDDRYCSSSEVNPSTGRTTAKSWSWTGLMLVKYPILTGVTQSDIWRLHIGYKMEISLTGIVLDAEGNPIQQGDYAEKCYSFYWEYVPAYIDRCGLDSGMTWTMNNNIGTLTVSVESETATTSFADWCYSDGSVIVESVEI